LSVVAAEEECPSAWLTAFTEQPAEINMLAKAWWGLHALPRAPHLRPRRHPATARGPRPL